MLVSVPPHLRTPTRHPAAPRCLRWRAALPPPLPRRGTRITDGTAIRAAAAGRPRRPRPGPRRPAAARAPLITACASLRAYPRAHVHTRLARPHPNSTYLCTQKQADTRAPGRLAGARPAARRPAPRRAAGPAAPPVAGAGAGARAAPGGAPGRARAQSPLPASGGRPTNIPSSTLFSRIVPSDRAIRSCYQISDLPSDLPDRNRRATRPNTRQPTAGRPEQKPWNVCEKVDDRRTAQPQTHARAPACVTNAWPPVTAGRAPQIHARPLPLTMHPPRGSLRDRAPHEARAPRRPPPSPRPRRARPCQHASLMICT